MERSSSKQTPARIAFKLAVFPAVLLFMSFPAVSQLGVVHYDTEKEASFNTSFTAGIINTGEQSYEVTVEVDNLEQASAATPESFVMEPSRIEASTEEEGWIYRGGRYIEPRDISFSIFGPEPDESFTLIVEARVVEDVESGEVSTDVVQVLEQRYELTGDVRGWSQAVEEHEDDSGPIIVLEEDEEDFETGEENRSRSEEVISSIRGDQSERDNNADDAGPGIKTLILAAAALVSVAILVNVL